MKRRFFLALVPFTLVLGLGPFAQAANAAPLAVPIAGPTAPLCFWNPFLPSLSFCLGQ
jgi:hypothetical protein